MNETDLVVQKIPAAPVTVVEPEAADITVVARNPQEMMVAQSRLVDWADRKVAEAKEERDDLAVNAETAKRNKWNHAALDRAVKRAQKRVEFYEKIHAALSAGYVIVPNMPMDVFAIRTTRSNPDRHQVTGDWVRPSEQVTNSPPLGDGRYVSAEASALQIQIAAPTTHDPKNTTWRRWAHAFSGVDFPFALAKPAIMSATAEAMALRIFDDLGASPAKAHHTAKAPKGDPMVIGRVLLRNGYQVRAVSFLITWFISTADL